MENNNVQSNSTALCSYMEFNFNEDAMRSCEEEEDAKMKM